MILVAYYSRKGHVRAYAEKFAKQNNYELLEIKDMVNRQGIFGFLKAGSQASRKIATPIGPIDRDLAAYEKVVLCTPVWAGNCACSVRTFLKTYGNEIKEIDYVIISGGKAGHESIVEDMDQTSGKTHKNVLTLTRAEL